MTVHTAFQASRYPDFHNGQTVHYRATDRTLIRAHILRRASNGTHAFMTIEGRLGTQYEPLSRCELIPTDAGEECLVVIVRGSPALAATCAKRRGIAWQRVRRSDCRIGKDESAGYVPLSQIGDVVRWFLEDTHGPHSSGPYVPANGACIYYARER